LIELRGNSSADRTHHLRLKENLTLRRFRLRAAKVKDLAVKIKPTKPKRFT
jgi:hypothetical protein